MLSMGRHLLHCCSQYKTDRDGEVPGVAAVVQGSSDPELLQEDGEGHQHNYMSRNTLGGDIRSQVKAHLMLQMRATTGETGSSTTYRSPSGPRSTFLLSWSII